MIAYEKVIQTVLTHMMTW